jgi:hypothetical protein
VTQHNSEEKWGRTTRAVVPDLWHPLLLDVFKARGGGYREADKEDVCLGVREGAKTVIVLLAWDVSAGPISYRGNCEIVERKKLACGVTARVWTRIPRDVGGKHGSPAVSNRPRVYGSSPIMTVTASTQASVNEIAVQMISQPRQASTRGTRYDTHSCQTPWGRIRTGTYSAQRQRPGQNFIAVAELD